MAKIYANRLILDKITWNEVPASRVEAVKEILRQITSDSNNCYNEKAQVLLGEN